MMRLAKDDANPHIQHGFPSPWGYEQTHGLGLLEYLYWAEDMELDPGMLIAHSSHTTC